MRPADQPLSALGVRIDAWIEEQRAADRWGKGPNQSDMARALGVSTSTVSDWKYGERVPSMNNLAKLAEFTGIPFAELVDLVQLVVSLRTGKKRSDADPDDWEGA